MTLPQSPADPMRFANETGHELFKLLAARGDAQLAQASDLDRFTALLSAALVPVAEVLRWPVARGRDRAAMLDKMIALSNRRLRELLQDVVDGRIP